MEREEESSIEQFVISIANGPGNLLHNRRQESSIKSHIEYQKSAQNLTLIDIDPKEAYQTLFGPGIKAFNEYMMAHNRQDLCYGNYYERQMQKEGVKPFYELVVQVGSIFKQIEDPSFNKMILTQFLESFIATSSNMAVIGAYIHCDESTDHLHLDFVPFYHPKNGLEIPDMPNEPGPLQQSREYKEQSLARQEELMRQKTGKIEYIKPPLLSSYKSAVQEMGYESAREWKCMLNREFQKILYGYNIEVLPMAKSEGHIVSRKIYKDVCHEVKIRKEALLKTVEQEVHKEKSRLYELEKERQDLEKTARAEMEKSRKEIEQSKVIEHELKDYTKELLIRTRELEKAYNEKAEELDYIEEKIEKAFEEIELDYADQIQDLHEQTTDLQKELTNELSAFKFQLLSQLEREVDQELESALHYHQDYQLQLEARLRSGLQNSREKIIESVLQDPELFSHLKENLVERLLSEPVQFLLQNIATELELAKAQEPDHSHPEKNKSIALSLQEARELIDAISSLDTRLERSIESQMAYQLDQQVNEILPILELDIRENFESSKEPSFISSIREKESSFIQKTRLKILKPKLSISPKPNLLSRRSSVTRSKELEISENGSPRPIKPADMRDRDIDIQLERTEYQESQKLQELQEPQYQQPKELQPQPPKAKESQMEPFEKLHHAAELEARLNNQLERAEQPDSKNPAVASQAHEQKIEQEIERELEPDQAYPQKEEPDKQPDFMEQSERMLETMERNEQESEQALKKMKSFEIELEI